MNREELLPVTACSETEQQKNTQLRKARNRRRENESSHYEAADVCHFFDLPTELRCRIYQCTVLEREPIPIPVPLELWPLYEGSFGTHMEQPAIARTNRQLRQESLPIYYGCNTFSGQCVARGAEFPFESWFQTIGEENRKLIRHVQVVNLFSERTIKEWLEWMKKEFGVSFAERVVVQTVPKEGT
ncbi:hypothetical protein LTR66_003824 [Elasticomyces elasticus]|nr:hypothetical protein LTR66_003824 [Elasticomyces elasticus]